MKNLKSYKYFCLNESLKIISKKDDDLLSFLEIILLNLILIKLQMDLDILHTAMVY